MMYIQLIFASFKAQAWQRLAWSVIFILLVLAALWLGQPGLANGSRNTTTSRARAGQAASDVPSVAGILNPDGTLHTGQSGSFDPSGYRMGLTATGAPRFVPES